MVRRQRSKRALCVFARRSTKRRLRYTAQLTVAFFVWLRTDPSTSDDSSSVSGGQLLIGILLVLLASALNAVQNVFEEKLLKAVGGAEVDPLELVGWEGTFGTLLSAFVLLPIVYQIPGPDCGKAEDSLNTLKQLQNSPLAVGLSLSFIFGLMLMNWTSQQISQQLSAVHRNLVSAVRTVLVSVFASLSRQDESGGCCFCSEQLKDERTTADGLLLALLLLSSLCSVVGSAPSFSTTPPRTTRPSTVSNGRTGRCWSWLVSSCWSLEPCCTATRASLHRRLKPLMSCSKASSPSLLIMSFRSPRWVNINRHSNNRLIRRRRMGCEEPMGRMATGIMPECMIRSKRAAASLVALTSSLTTSADLCSPRPLSHRPFRPPLIARAPPPPSLPLFDQPAIRSRAPLIYFPLATLHPPLFPSPSLASLLTPFRRPAWPQQFHGRSHDCSALPHLLRIQSLSSPPIVALSCPAALRVIFFFRFGWSSSNSFSHNELPVLCQTYAVRSQETRSRVRVFSSCTGRAAAEAMRAIFERRNVMLIAAHAVWRELRNLMRIDREG